MHNYQLVMIIDFLFDFGLVIDKVEQVLAWDDLIIELYAILVEILDDEVVILGAEVLVTEMQ